MIPVRVRGDAKPVLASERRFPAHRGHPLDSQPCPVCDRPLGDGVAVLVFAGIAPEDRKPGGYTTGGAVAVHAACAGVPDEEPPREGCPYCGATGNGGHGGGCPNGSGGIDGEPGGPGASRWP